MSTSSTIFFLIVALVVLGLVFNLLRSRKLREKYAALWVTVGLVIVILAIFPGLLEWLARVVGIQVPSNLLFLLSLILLLGVCLQLSLEISRTEDKIRVLAENIAILNLQARSSGSEELLAHSADAEPTVAIDPPSRHAAPEAQQIADEAHRN